MISQKNCNILKHCLGTLIFLKQLNRIPGKTFLYYLRVFQEYYFLIQRNLFNIILVSIASVAYKIKPLYLERK